MDEKEIKALQDEMTGIMNGITAEATRLQDAKLIGESRVKVFIALYATYRNEELAIKRAREIVEKLLMAQEPEAPVEVKP